MNDHPQLCGMSLTLRVAAATKATAAAQEARPARAMGLLAVETAWTRNGEERAPTSASRFTRDAEVMASCPALEKVSQQLPLCLDPTKTCSKLVSFKQRIHK